jgi:signal peptidase I
MENTFYTGDYLFANKLAKIERGSVVIIEGESRLDDSWLIKRIIGLPGETVTIENGYVYITPEDSIERYRLDEPYIKRQGVTKPSQNGNTTWKLGENEYFYLGDNRENSTDSRSNYGGCDESQIIGVVQNWSIKLAQIIRKVKR